MSYQKQLREQYEDAAFALLLAEIADREGEALLKEAERLNEDPSAAVPEDLDKACRKLLRISARKGRNAPVKRTTARIAKFAAVAVLAAVLMVTAFAAIPHVRVGVLNLMLTLQDDGNTGMSFGPGTPPGESASSNAEFSILNYALPEIPADLPLVFVDEDEKQRALQYEDGMGHFLSIDVVKSSTGGNYVVDTEGAQEVREVTINGHKGLLALEDGKVLLAWADAEHMVCFSICSNAVDEAAVMNMALQMVYVEPGR